MAPLGHWSKQGLLKEEPKNPVRVCEVRPYNVRVFRLQPRDPGSLPSAAGNSHVRAL